MIALTAKVELWLRRMTASVRKAPDADRLTTAATGNDDDLDARMRFDRVDKTGGPFRGVHAGDAQ